jgi:endonuclease/exonuclease/phosphatase family metal-dependent hydrolase
LTRGVRAAEGRAVRLSSFLLCTGGLVAWLGGCASSSRTPPDAADLPDAQVVDGGEAPIDAPPTAPPGQRLRLVAANITSGNNQAYEAPGIRILRGLNADVAMLQELNVGGNTPPELQAFVTQAFGAGYTMAREGNAQIPNGIVSRYPILASGEWDDPEVGNRDFVWARIDIPGPIDLFAISVHLLTSNATERNAEATELLRNIQLLPADAYVVLGGDFNTQTRTEACITTLAPAFVTAGPYPVDQAGIENTNAGRNRPYDWVLVDRKLHDLETDVAIGRSRFANGFVVDTRVYSPITDLAPAMISDSGVTNMQHMAIVRDFDLPAPAGVQVVAPNGGETWAIGSSQTVRWSAIGAANVRVELTTDGATWTVLAASTAASAGQLAVTAPATATTMARVRVSALPDGGPSDESDAPFTIAVGPPPAGLVFINEVLANEPGSDPAGELVELVNGGTTDADISGWTIRDGLQVRHTFAPGTVLRAGRAIAVFGGAAGIPVGLGNAIAASTGELNLSNGGDTVALASPAAAIDSVTYTSALSGTDGVSMNRDPDGVATGVLVLHTALVAAQRSPGTRASGAAF